MADTSYAKNNHATAGAPPLRGVADRLQAAALERDRIRLQKQLGSLLKGIKSPVVEEAVHHVFTRLAHLRELLRLVEVNVSEGGPLPVTMAAFALLDSESKSLVRFIEARVSRNNSIKGPLREAFDGMSFAIRHELKTVFAHELSGLDDGRPAKQTLAGVLRAHGLLCNCFEQSIINIIRVFEPSASAELLFEDYRARLKQSAVLLRELFSLLQLARRAEKTGEPAAAAAFFGALKDFCEGTMHHLMYKDWGEFEDLAREVMSSQGSPRGGILLHCFVTYLETLINQVRMRVVLSEQLAAAPTSEPKPVKKSPRGRR